MSLNVVLTGGFTIDEFIEVSKKVARAPDLPISFLIVLGWYELVTGQAAVLYSRIHLVIFNQ